MFQRVATVIYRLSSVVCLLSSALYICREPSTNQLFYAKQTQFPKSRMNVSIYSQMEYENKCDWTIGQSKPNSNPIKPNFQKAQMNVNLLITKDYRKNDDFAVRINKPNSNPISVKPKMSANVYFIEDYENETTFRPKKTNPNKPNFPTPKLRRLLITLFGSGYAVIRHSGSVYFQCAYSYSASLLEKHRKK